MKTMPSAVAVMAIKIISETLELHPLGTPMSGDVVSNLGRLTWLRNCLLDLSCEGIAIEPVAKEAA